MGNNECCGRLKDSEDKLYLVNPEHARILGKDSVPLKYYDIKPYSQVINNMCKEMIRLDELIQ